MNKKLTDEQVALLAPYEKHFGTAIRSGYSSYPGQAALDTMLQVWSDLTGQTYPFSKGCSNCIMNLLKDMGSLYYQATGKDPFDHAKVVKTYKAPSAPAAPQETPETAEAPVEVEQPTAEQKKAQNGAKKASKAK